MGERQTASPPYARKQREERLAAMTYSDQLFRWLDPYDLAGTEGLFAAALAESAQRQAAGCPDYARILALRGYDRAALEAGDLSALPPIPTLYCKRHLLLSVPEKKLLVRATSSGTGGTVSRMGLDAGSLLRGARMVWRMTRYHRLLSPRPCRYLILGYQPRRENQTAFSKTGFGFTFFAPALSRTYALRWHEGSYRLDMEGLRRRLLRCAGGRSPVRTIGFPAYTYLLLRQLEEEGVRLRLPRGSMVTMGGGWKQFEGQKVEKEELYRLAESVLGIPEENCVEFFGAVEHPILYTTCRRHHFHVPVYSRVLIRDPDTLAPVPNGTPGLVNLLTPMVGSVPVLSIMTDDLGVLHDGAECPCGIQSPWLELKGRVGVRDIVTCAAGAAEFLRGGSAP